MADSFFCSRVCFIIKLACVGAVNKANAADWGSLFFSRSLCLWVCRSVYLSIYLSVLTYAHKQAHTHWLPENHKSTSSLFTAWLLVFCRVFLVAQCGSQNRSEPAHQENRLPIPLIFGTFPSFLLFAPFTLFRLAVYSLCRTAHSAEQFTWNTILFRSWHHIQITLELQKNRSRSYLYTLCLRVGIA